MKNLIFPCYLKYIRYDGVSGITYVKSIGDLEKRMKLCFFIDLDLKDINDNI